MLTIHLNPAEWEEVSSLKEGRSVTSRGEPARAVGTHVTPANR